MKSNLLILVILILFGNKSFAQDKKITRTGQIIFEASVPSFEEVKAKNEIVTCILNTKTGEIASLALMKSFRFKIALMEEHFNEHYVESDDFPKASFKGIIEGFNWNIIGNSQKEFKMNGVLELHGKSKKINTTVLLRKVGDGLEIISNFDLNPEDFKIEIPKIVSHKVAKTINIKTMFLVK